MRRILGLAAFALLAASCTAAVVHPKSVKPVPTSTTTEPFEATQKPVQTPGYEAPSSSSTEPPRIVLPETTTTLNPGLLANVDYWRSRLAQDQGSEHRQQTLVNQDQGTADESSDVQTLERDQTQVSEDQQNLDRAESEYEKAQNP